MATPDILGRQRFQSMCQFLSVAIVFVIMDTGSAFNYSEKTMSCEQLSCANNNVCFTSFENGTQVSHAYCQCRGQWAGLRCQSKLHVSTSSISKHSVTLHIRGMTSSLKRVPFADLHISGYTVSFWNLNGSDGCSILQMKPVTPWVTIDGLDRNQSYSFCLANGNIDFCRLKSSNYSEVSQNVNCVSAITTESDHNLDIGLIIVPIASVIFIIIVIIIVCVKRHSLFVQFLLNVCCCRKCYCIRKRVIRKKRYLMKKQRNISGNVLLSPEPPFDDSMSFAPSFASTSLSSNAIGNRSSIVSDSFRSGFTPESEDRFPTYLEENPNPLYNPNVISNMEFCPTSNVDFHSTPSKMDFQCDTNPVGNNLMAGQGLNSLHNTFRGSSNFASSYFTNDHNETNDNSPEDTQIPVVSSAAVHNSIPENYFSNEFYNTQNPLPITPLMTQNHSQFIPNGKIHRQYSCPTAGGKSPPGAVRVFPHGNEWTSYIHRQGDPERNRQTMDRRDSVHRRRRIIRQRPLSYNLDYRYPINMDYYTDDMKELLGLKPSTSQDAFKVSTLPRSSRKRNANESPRRMNKMDTASSQSFYAINTLPHPIKNTESSTTLTPDTIPNGDIFTDDVQSTISQAESNNSKDSNKSDPPHIKQRVKSLISQFERTLPFLRQQSSRSSTSFCDDEFFKDLASPLAVERKQNTKKKNRPISYPHLYEARTSAAGSNPSVIGVDPIFQGHPSQHFLPPFTTDDDEAEYDVNVIDKDDVISKERRVSQTLKTSSKASHKDVKGNYVISAFDDDSTNLVTPFILKKSSSDDSIDKETNLLSNLNYDYV